jgi:DNA modification methylase
LQKSGAKEATAKVVTGLTPAQKREFIVKDNASFGDWNMEDLANSWADLPLADWGVDLPEDWLGADKGVAADAEPQIDKAEELNKVWRVTLGDLWQIGDHRLLCGDSTKKEDVGRVMGEMKADMVFTDPPYGVDYDGGTTKRKKLEGDTGTELYKPCCLMARDFSDDKAPLYLWHAGVKGIAAAAAAAAAAAGYEIRCELVWNKNIAQFGALSAQYKQKHEPAYYCFKKGKAPRWFGPTNEVTVWDVDRSSVNEFHPTQKPPELAIRAIKNSTETGNIVADWFGGSGATMVACQNTKRKCRMIELTPDYCAVILQRMHDAFPDLEIRRIE